MRRYEKIMRAIDDGKTDEELAEMFPDKSITKKSMISTMRMYRLVHDKRRANSRGDKAATAG